MRPNDRDLFTEDVVDFLVDLVGRLAYERMDPEDPRHGPFLDWLAREARLSQSAAERKETERQSALFAERIQRRVASARAAERHRVRCVDEAPVTYEALVDRDDDHPAAVRERTTPWWDLAVAAGSGRELWDELPAAFIELPDDVEDGQYVALTVAGDSMAPLLHTGDTILVRLGRELTPDQVVVARHPEQGYVVKRVGRMRASHVELASLNPDYPTLTIPRDPALVLGTVVLRWCPHVRGRLPA
jgi:SOS-response transcriptional repressor LexA